MTYLTAYDIMIMVIVGSGPIASLFMHLWEGGKEE